MIFEPSTRDVHDTDEHLAMRRFSQRNSLVTLSDINITPLLDLAFVLLIIFVITTPLLEQGLNLKLPAGGAAGPQESTRATSAPSTSAPQGQYKMAGRAMDAGPDPTRAQLKAERKRNPNLLVYIRADREGLYDYVAALLYRLEVAGVTRRVPAHRSQRQR